MRNEEILLSVTTHYDFAINELPLWKRERENNLFEIIWMELFVCCGKEQTQDILYSRQINKIFIDKCNCRRLFDADKIIQRSI